MGLRTRHRSEASTLVPTGTPTPVLSLPLLRDRGEGRHHSRRERHEKTPSVHPPWTPNDPGSCRSVLPLRLHRPLPSVRVGDDGSRRGTSRCRSGRCSVRPLCPRCRRPRRDETWWVPRPPVSAGGTPGRAGVVRVGGWSCRPVSGVAVVGTSPVRPGSSRDGPEPLLPTFPGDAYPLTSRVSLCPCPAVLCTLTS